MTLFVQLYESNTEAVKSEIATFFEAFPKGMIFANTYNGAGYDLVLLGQADGTTINLDEMEARLQRPEYAPVAKSLAEIGMHSAVDLFATYAGSAEDLKGWPQDAQINRDRMFCQVGTVSVLDGTYLGRTLMPCETGSPAVVVRPVKPSKISHVLRPSSNASARSKSETM